MASPPIGPRGRCRGAIQNRPYGSGHAVLEYRFGQKGHHRGGLGKVLFGIPKRRNQNEGNARPDISDSGRQLFSRHFRHVLVRDDEIDLPGVTGELFQRRHTVLRLKNVVTKSPELFGC